MPVKKSSAVGPQTSDKKLITKSLRVKAKQSSQGKKPRNDKMSVPVYSLIGKQAGTLSLPKEIFGKEVNKKLLAQAVRVYMTNQKSLLGSTKTRGQVEGSTAKISRQKGTGRARHGSVRAPIFVGGGIVFGPSSRKVRLEMPKSMKKAALLSALSSKFSDKDIAGLTGLEKASGKTKEMVKLMHAIVSQHSQDKKQKSSSALIVVGGKNDNLVRAVRNIVNITVLPADGINAFEVLKHKMLLITEEAIAKLSNPQTKETK